MLIEVWPAFADDVKGEMLTLAGLPERTKSSRLRDDAAAIRVHAAIVVELVVDARRTELCARPDEYDG